MRIGIIGCGITGLTAAYGLSKAGHEVELFEEESTLGGIAGSVQIDGYNLEKYYHHFFRSDRYIISMLEELGLLSSLLWKESRMGYFADGKSYEFGTPISLIKFEPLSLMNKIKFGVSVLKIMAIKDWRPLEQVTAEKWLIENAGEEVFLKVWRPLLVTKFGEQYEEISMAWFWGKIRLRGTSKEKGKEVLGYIAGSSAFLFERLEQQLLEKGVQINLNCRVNKIKKKDEGFILETAQESKSFDRIIAAVPLPILGELAADMLPEGYMQKIRSIEYTSVVCMVLTLKKPFSRFYWLNIGDEGIPFGGLIEHTNLLDKRVYNDKHILYISNYMYKTNILYGMSDEELLKEYIPHLKKVNPEFDADWILELHTFKDEYAQPVIKCGYSKLKPEFETPVKGLYTAGMSNIYPEDRGVNYAVRDGRDVAKLTVK